MFDSRFRSLAAASVARGCVGAWLDGGCFRRGPGGLRRGLLMNNNCRPPVELITIRAKDTTMMVPGGEALPLASRGVRRTMLSSRENPHILAARCMPIEGSADTIWPTATLRDPCRCYIIACIRRFRLQQRLPLRIALPVQAQRARARLLQQQPCNRYSVSYTHLTLPTKA